MIPTVSLVTANGRQNLAAQRDEPARRVTQQTSHTSVGCSIYKVSVAGGSSWLSLPNSNLCDAPGAREIIRYLNRNVHPSVLSATDFRLGALAANASFTEVASCT
jgi:hypothetical protein